MIKTMFAFGALTLAIAAPAAAQMAADAPATGSVPMCSATVHDSCNQGANNPRAMSADQAMASGGVGDRKDDKSDYMAPAMAGKSGKPMMHKHMMHHHMMHHTMTKSTSDTPTTDAKPM